MLLYSNRSLCTPRDKTEVEISRSIVGMLQLVEDDSREVSRDVVMAMVVVGGVHDNAVIWDNIRSHWVLDVFLVDNIMTSEVVKGWSLVVVVVPTTASAARPVVAEDGLCRCFSSCVSWSLSSSTE